MFAALNIVGLGIAEVVIAATTYGLGMKSALAYNAASVAGTGLGTIFRYFSYKRWVFLADAPSTVVAAGEAALSGIIDASGAGYGPPWEPIRQGRSYGPPWEHLDPAGIDIPRR